MSSNLEKTQEMREKIGKGFYGLKEIYNSEVIFNDNLKVGLRVYQPFIRENLPPEDALRIIESFDSAIKASDKMISDLNRTGVQSLANFKANVLKDIPLEELQEKQIELQDMMHSVASVFETNAYREYSNGMAGLIYGQKEFDAMLLEFHLGLGQVLQEAQKAEEVERSAGVEKDEEVEKAEKAEKAEGYILKVQTIQSIGGYTILPLQRLGKYPLLFRLMRDVEKDLIELSDNPAKEEDRALVSASKLVTDRYEKVNERQRKLEKIKGTVEERFNKAHKSNRSKVSSAKSKVKKVLHMSSARDKLREEIVHVLSNAIAESKRTSDYTGTLAAIERLKKKVQESPKYKEKRSATMKVLLEFEEKYTAKQAGISSSPKPEGHAPQSKRSI